MRFDLSKRARLRYGVLAVATTLLLAGWLVMGENSTGSDRPKPTQPSASAAPITAAFGPAFADLRTIKKAAVATKLPVYWLGDREGTRIEMTVNSVGVVYLRYLPADVAAGSDQPFLLVASYPDSKAVENVRKPAKGGVSGSLPDGTVYSGDGPKGVRMYQATPGTSVQVEVYSPIQGEAFEVVTSGRVMPVG